MDIAPIFFELALSLVSHKWTVKQIDEGLFHFQKLGKNYIVNQLNDNLFNVKSDENEMVGSAGTLYAYFCECRIGMYDCNFKNKIVLDVGGFHGETAVFFSSQGARKVIIYEPVPAFHNFIKKT